MKILAVDTALAACSAAVYDDEVQRVLAAAFQPMATGHAEVIGPMVRDVMAGASLRFADLNRIAATNGPGTFTGLRIGLAFARGLGLALNLPIVGISSLKAIAANISPNPDALPIAVLIDARRGNVYSQLFSPTLEPLNEASAHTLAEAAARLPVSGCWTIGSAADDLMASDPDLAGRVRRSDASAFPHASLIAALASREPDPDGPPAPLYLRPPHATPQGPQLGRIALRQAGIDEAATLSNLHARCFDRPWSAESFRTLLSLPGALAFLATSATGEASGFLLARSAAGEAEILTLAVAPPFRRRGLASRLIAKAAAVLGSAGACRLYIEVAGSNVPARRLYEKAGFAVTGVRRNYYSKTDGGREDAIVMSWPLPIANHGI
jgi:tRNA threonylcarbamoyl adenosine modification protein YeaZ/ribosomal-protein-alanine acetyltransferase